MQSISFASGGDPVSALGVVFSPSCWEWLGRGPTSEVHFLGCYQESLHFHFVSQAPLTTPEALVFLPVRGNESHHVSASPLSALLGSCFSTGPPTGPLFLNISPLEGYEFT